MYLSDAEVPIDANHLERALRPVPAGRHNWLFAVRLDREPAPGASA